MKERTIVGVIFGILVLGGVIAATRSTDLIFVIASLAFFGLCIAYAKWCERL